MINFMMLVGFAFSVCMFFAAHKQGYKSGHRKGFEACEEHTHNLHREWIVSIQDRYPNRTVRLLPAAAGDLQCDVFEIIRAQNALLSDDDKMLVALQWPEVLAIVKEGDGHA